MEYRDENGELLAWDTFTHACPDCGDTCSVVDGLSEPHDCPMPPELRGRVGQAWADGEQWVLDHADEYGLVKA